MEIQQSFGPERTDELLSTLSDRHCRFVLSYFTDTTEKSASVNDLATALARRDPADENRVTGQLHHSTLPKLEDVGAVEYDARSNTVRYHGHSELENWHEYISGYTPEDAGEEGMA